MYSNPLPTAATPLAPPVQPLRYRLPRLTSLVLTIGMLAGLAACGASNAPPAGPPGGMPPAEVGVVTVTPGDVGLITELPGRLEGSYQASLASAQASLVRAEANLMQTSAQAERYKPLAAAQAVSQQEFVNAQAAQKQAEADVAASKAAIQTARINLAYATVTAPISGRIGRSLVTEGALVGQGEATPLAVIQQINPLYVNFTQSASDFLALRRAMESGKFKRAGNQAASVQVLLEDGSEYPHPGKLLFSDLTVDANTGQITLRAELPNPGGTLLPGLYVRVRLEQAQASNAITLPQQAVTRSSQGDSVMVVGSDGKVKPRPVKVGSQQQGQWIILDGLKAGEQVMVDGFQKLRGDAPVKAVPWRAPGTSAPANAASKPVATTAMATAASGPAGSASAAVR